MIAEVVSIAAKSLLSLQKKESARFAKELAILIPNRLL
jgi:hypothetical protein